MSDTCSSKEKLQNKNEAEDTLKETHEETAKQPKVAIRGDEKPIKEEISPPRSIFRTPPIVKTKQPKALKLVVPNLTSKRSTFVKPKLIPSMVKSISTVIPKLSTIFIKREEDFRISLIEPLPLCISLPLLYPKLRLKQAIDVSVRPIIYYKVATPIKPLRPLLKITRIVIPRLPIIPTTISRTTSLREPKIRIMAIEVPTQVTRTEAAITTEDFKEVTKNLLTTLFEPEDEEQGISGILYVKPDKPVVILAEKVEGEEYIETLKHILREVYRIKVGGLPRPEEIRVDKRRVEEVKAEKRIVVIHDTDADFFHYFGVKKAEDLETKADPKKFIERIGELFSQTFGYIIIHASNERLDQVKKVLATVSEQIPKLFYLKAKRFETEDEKFNIASSVWGFVEPKGLTGKSLDKLFLSCENEFWDKLEKLVKTPKYDWVKESLEDEEGSEGYESSLHYLLKVFLASYFTERGVFVETECKLEKGVADLYIPSEDLAVEIETLYGAGVNIWRKIGRTIEKYEGTQHKVWIVMPNLQMTLCLEGITKQSNKLMKENKSIEFYTIDLKRKEPVKLDKYSKLLKGFCFRNHPTSSH